MLTLAKFRFKTKKDKLNLFKYKEDFNASNNMAGPHIEMFSNKEVFVDGCGGILEYNDVYVKIRIKKGMIIISGTNIDIPVFEGKTITIKGTIDSIEFCVG